LHRVKEEKVCLSFDTFKKFK